MKTAVFLTLAAMPARHAFSPSPPSTPWYGHRGAVPAVRPYSSRAQMTQTFGGALAESFSPGGLRLIARCAAHDDSQEPEPEPEPEEPEEGEPEEDEDDCVLPELTGAIGEEDLWQVVADAVPSLGRRSLETTLRLIWLVYDEDFRTGCLFAGDKPIPAVLARQVAVDSSSDMYCTAATEHLLVTRSRIGHSEAGAYLHTRVIIRGTNFSDKRDLAVDLRTQIPRKVRLPLEDEDGRIVTVGKGFIDRYVDLAPIIIEAVADNAAFASEHGLRHEVTFGGHSLGASVGIFGAMDHAERQKAHGVSGPPVRVVALSPPQPGFFDAFNELLLEEQEENRLKAFQVRHRGDPISSLPLGATVPMLPLIELEGVAEVGLFAMDNHGLEELVDRFKQVIDDECRMT